MTPAAFDKRSVVILNDTMFPPAAGGNALKRFVEARRRPARRDRRPHHVAAGRSGDCCRAVSARPSIARRAAAGSLGYLDYSHPIFEVFKAPRSGDFSAAHIFRYRTLQSEPTDRVLARFDDGAIAAAERKIGAGRVDRVDVDAGRLVDRHRREADLPAARAPARAVSRALRTSHRRGSPSARSSTSPRAPRARGPVGPHRRDAIGRAHLARGRRRGQRRAARAERAGRLRSPADQRADAGAPKRLRSTSTRPSRS